MHSKITGHWTSYFLSLVLFFASAPAFSDVANVQIIDAALKTPGPKGAPLATPLKVAVSLPDRWPVEQVFGTWTYHLSTKITPCNAQAPCHEPWALWIKAVGGDIRIWVNDQMVSNLIGIGGGPDDSLRRPQLVVIPQALLHSGSNEVTIEVKSTGAPAADGLSRIWWGPANALGEIHAKREHRILGTSYAVAFVAAIGCLGAMVVAVRLGRTEAWFFFLASLFWALRETVLLLGPWGWLANEMAQVTVMSQGIAVCSAVLLMLSLLPEKQPWATRVTTFVLVSLPFVTYVMHGHQSSGHALTWLHAGWLIPGAMMILTSMKSAWTHRSRMVMLIAGANLVSALLMNIDIWQLHIGRSQMGFEHLPLTSYLLLTFSVVVGMSALLRIGEVLRKEQNQSSELYRQVRLQRDEIDALYRGQIERQNREAVAAERSRIVRDMHDGLGSHLVGLLSTVQSSNYSQQELKQDVSDALDELRMTIDTLEPMDDDLAGTLGQLRFRLDSRLRHCGIQVKWSMERLPQDCIISPLQQTHLRRLLYEAFTNIIKHAQATSISVTGYLDSNARCHTIVVKDNGKGFDLSAQGGGRGLSNMKTRAKLMAAQLDISSVPSQGTQIQISLPAKLDF